MTTSLGQALSGLLSRLADTSESTAEQKDVASLVRSRTRPLDSGSSSTLPQRTQSIPGVVSPFAFTGSSAAKDRQTAQVLPRVRRSLITDSGCGFLFTLLARLSVLAVEVLLGTSGQVSKEKLVGVILTNNRGTGLRPTSSQRGLLGRPPPVFGSPWRLLVKKRALQRPFCGVCVASFGRVVALTALIEQVFRTKYVPATASVSAPCVLGWHAWRLIHTLAGSPYRGWLPFLCPSSLSRRKTDTQEEVTATRHTEASGSPMRDGLDWWTWAFYL